MKHISVFCFLTLVSVLTYGVSLVQANTNPKAPTIAQTLFVTIQSLNRTTGAVVFSGVDTKPVVNTGFVWIWGDGTTTNGFFPQTKTYSNTSRNYTAQVVSNYTDGQTDTVSVFVEFVGPTVAGRLLSFAFRKANNPSLSEDISLSAVGGYSLLTVPTGTNLSALKASFTASEGVTVSVNGLVQNSDISVNNFTQPVSYLLSMPNTVPASYTIEVSVQTDLAAVDNAVMAFMTKHSVPGMSIAITKDERLVYAKGYGLADKDQGEPVTAKSIFRIGSVSKSITGIAAMKLVDEGRLNLDQKVFGVGSILGTFYGSQPYTPQLEQITVRQLLNHTAGGDAWNSLWDYPTRIDPLFQPEWLNYTQSQLISTVLDTRPVTQTPGTLFAYSNIGMSIAGRVIEKVSGMSYEEYILEKILKPLGISPNSMRIGGSTLAERVPNEVIYYQQYPGYDQPYAFPISRLDAAGGWITTAINLIRLLTTVDGLRGRADILSGSSLSQLLTASPVSLSETNGINGYGLGCYVYPSLNWVTHQGSLAGGTAVWWRRTSEGYTWVFLMNRSAGATYDQDKNNLGFEVLANPISFMKGDQFDVFFKYPETGLKNYCSPIQRDEWSCTSTTGTIGIQSVKIWSAGKASVLLDSKNVCSQNGNAYSNLTNLPPIQLQQGSTFPFQIEAMRIQSGNNQGGIYPVRISIWLDVNHDMTFTENERLFVSNPSVAFPNPFLERQFTVPITALTGLTRMRIRAGTAFTTIPESACEQIDGETEDYIVNIETNCLNNSSVKIGNWNDPSVWSCNRVPTAADPVSIKHIISIPTSYIANALRISYTANGQLIYNLGGRLLLGQ